MIERPTSTGGRRAFLKGAGALAGASFVGRTVASTDGRSGTTNERIVGYYPYWGDDYSPEDIPWDIVTHVDYAFLRPQSDGTVAAPAAWETPLINSLANASDERTSLLFSISGGWYPQEYSDAALTPERRERFAKTALEHVRTYGFDGIDLDWEYPNGRTREEDPQNLTLLLAEIRRQFDKAEEKDGKTYELTMAVSPNTAVAEPMEVGKFAEDVDFLSVMNYNFHGTWSARTHFNAPLYPVPDAPNASPQFTADYAMRWWADQPIANEKLNFGVPFYGRTFANVENERPADRGLFQQFEGGDALTYEKIEGIPQESDYSYYWHPEARVPWLYSEADNRFISYDDSRSIKEKTKYTVDNDFGGMMCWELTQDPSNTLLETIDRHNSNP